MQRTPRLAAAQTTPIAGDVHANLRQHLQLAGRAAERGVTLLAFPELSLTGYELALGPALAFDLDDARLEPLAAAARAYAMTLVVGAPWRAASGLHIAAFILDPGGGRQVYAKRHLGAFRPEDHPEGAVPPPEAEFFVAGTSDPLIGWGGHRCATSICADAAYRSHPCAAAERGAVLYLSCQFAIAAHMAFKISRLEDAARRHGLTVVFANYGGTTGGLVAAGGSCVLGPDGEVVARLPAMGDGLAIAWQDGTRWAGEAM